MERRIQTLKKHLILVSAVFFAFSVQAQVPSQKEQLRIQIWSELDEFPGVFEESGQTSPRTSTVLPQTDTKTPSSVLEARTLSQAESLANPTALSDSAVAEDITPFAFAINRAKEITPFLMGGMIHGWAFEYVPYDKTRGVSEYFDCSEVNPFDKQVNPISYKAPQIQENKLLCWAYCDRTPEQQLAFQRWESIIHPKIHGHGSAPVQDGFLGIQEACKESVKNAVREYWRTKVKNKPKEIDGTVLLIQNPRIYIYEGQYVVDLDFFLKTDRITLYSYY